MKNCKVFIFVLFIIIFSGCTKAAAPNTNNNELETTQMSEKVQVDFSKKKGTPLFKKFALFNSGITPMKNYSRDIETLDGLNVESLRIDLFLGNDKMPFGNTVTGTKEKMKYDFSELDKLVNMLNNYGVRPYWSWCYIPEPLQISGDWRDGPNDLIAWQTMFKNFSQHYKELGISMYHEVYNEPDCGDTFFLGSWEDYIQMYKYGAKGLKQGNPDAVIGGPATAFIEKQSGIDSFLKMVIDEDLPLDFFSFHSYGYEKIEYISRVKIARKALSRYQQFDTTELHMNELNIIPYPWASGGAVDRTETAVRMLTSFEKLLDETDLTLVHWSEWLESTLDGVGAGMVDKQGQLKSSMHAYKMYNEMPLDRAEVKGNKNIHLLASSDENMAYVLLWNEEDVNHNIEITLNNIPFEKGDIYIYRLDDESYEYPFENSKELSPIEEMSEIKLDEFKWEGEVAGYGIVYIKVLNSSPEKSEHIPVAGIQRKHHYYPERDKSNYAEFGEDNWMAWLGMGQEVSARSIVGITIEGVPDKFICSLNLNGRINRIDNNTYLGIRVDYKVDEQYVKAVDFQILESDVRRNAIMPWGTKNQVDETVNIENVITDNVIIDILRYAPENWSRSAVITFDMHSTGKDTQAVFKLR